MEFSLTDYYYLLHFKIYYLKVLYIIENIPNDIEMDIFIEEYKEALNNLLDSLFTLEEKIDSLLYLPDTFDNGSEIANIGNLCLNLMDHCGEIIDFNIQYLKLQSYFNNICSSASIY